MFCFHFRPSFLIPKTHRDSFSMNCIAYCRRRYKRKVQENLTKAINLTCVNIVTNIRALYVWYAGAYAPAYQTVIYTEYTRRPPIGVMIPEAV